MFSTLYIPKMYFSFPFLFEAEKTWTLELTTVPVRRENIDISDFTEKKMNSSRTPFVLWLFSRFGRKIAFSDFLFLFFSSKMKYCTLQLNKIQNGIDRKLISNKKMKMIFFPFSTTERRENLFASDLLWKLKWYKKVNRYWRTHKRVHGLTFSTYTHTHTKPDALCSTRFPNSAHTLPFTTSLTDDQWNCTRFRPRSNNHQRNHYLIDWSEDLWPTRNYQGISPLPIGDRTVIHANRF